MKIGKLLNILMLGALLLGTLTVGAAPGAGIEGIAGSTVTGGTCYQPGITSTQCFTVYNNSSDTEWLDMVSLRFPTGWQVACHSQDPADSGGNLVNLTCDHSGPAVYYSDSDGGYGEIYDGESWGFCVNVTPLAYASLGQTVNWALSGDEWGDPPHDINGSLTLLECGELQGQVTDAELPGAAPTCTQAQVHVEPGYPNHPVDPATGDYGPLAMMPGNFAEYASAPGYQSSATIYGTIAQGETTTQDFSLHRAVVEVRPADLISVSAVVNQEISYPLTLTNQGGLPLNYQISESPSELPWAWEDPISGTLPAASHTAVDVHFLCTQVQDYVGALLLNNSDPCQPQIEIPIALHCLDDQGETYDLGDAPDSSNHSGASMTAYPPGGPPGVLAAYPTVFDPATGLPQGPRHALPTADAWLGLNVSLEFEADLPPDQDGLTNLDPPLDLPDLDGFDDGLLPGSLNLNHCFASSFNYQVTVDPGSPLPQRYFNAWFDWNRDGDWEDVLECPDGTQVPEWAVQNQLLSLGPGLWVISTPSFLAFQPDAPTWMRLTLAEGIAPINPGTGWADGRGPADGHLYGETEDYYLEGQPPPEWIKRINGLEWRPDLVVTVETSDTIQVVDILVAGRDQTLLETWNPAELDLLDWGLDPPIGTVETGDNWLSWELPPGETTPVTLTKYFHVEPCTWELTFLSEELWAGGEPVEQRPVPFFKLPPLLQLDSDYNPAVYAGEPANFTLLYRNDGGYENNIWVLNEFPPEAPFAASNPPPTDQDPNGLWASWYLGDLANGTGGEILVTVDILPGLSPSTTIPIMDWIYNHLGDPVDDALTEFHVEEPLALQWFKYVNGQPWDPDMIYTVETSDTIEIVDVFVGNLGFSFGEGWNPEELQMFWWDTQPAGVGLVTPGPDFFQWQVPPAPGGVYTLTKLFHVEPCTWDMTTIEEALQVDGAPAPVIRPVWIHKLPPELWIDSQYQPEVPAGTQASFTLIYSNTGGYENNVVIRNEFPPQAPFAFSDPLPDREDPAGLWVEWDVGDLANGSRGVIDVTVALAGSLVPSDTVTIVDVILNHVGVVMGETYIEFHVPPPTWEKWVNGLPWTPPELLVTAQTSDTITVVELIHPTSQFDLVETWDSAHLWLEGWTLDPPGLGVVIPDPAAGSLVWQVPAGAPELITMTKYFHVEPCTWAETVLWEELWIGGVEYEQRPVIIVKLPSDLWIDSLYHETVSAGQSATFTLSYGNGGAFENDIMIRNEFPPEAPFDSSAPAPNRLDPAGLWAEWDVGDLPNGAGGEINVAVALAPTLYPSATIPIWDGIFDHARILRDETLIEFHVGPPEWLKWVNGQPWAPPLITQTVETSDTIVVVEQVRPTSGVALVEFWDADLLDLLDYQLEPPVGGVISDTGFLAWEVPAGAAELLTMTKIYHVEPCYWSDTLIWEELWAGGFWIEYRPVRFEKLPPDLWIDSSYPERVFAGQVVSFTLLYGNQGGYENDVMIRNEFPPEAPYEHADPPADRVDPLGLWAEWDLGDLAMNAQGNIQVAVSIDPTLPPSTTIDIWDWIYDHLGEPVDQTLIRLHVAPPVTFPGGPWPWYAQGEISVDPEPPLARSPVRLCAEVVNHDPISDHPAALQFGVAPLGIGMLYTPVGVANLVVPAGGSAVGCVVWVPPSAGPWSIQVRLIVDGAADQFSQRNLDLEEPLRPNQPHALAFPLRNPFAAPVTITLGLVPHLPDWGLELSHDVLPNLAPGATHYVTLTVTPPAQMPEDGQPIVDVEAFVNGELMGGFRKIYRPPVPLHRYPDPVYAEREITIHPYPVRAGEPTELCVELRNASSSPQDVLVWFSWAHFGIGLPFTPIDGPRVVHLPPHAVVRECLHWIPPVNGPVCVQVYLEMDDHADQLSRRNVDDDEPLRPNTTHARAFTVGNPFQEPVTITLGLVPHLPDWGLELSQDVIPNLAPGLTRTVILTVTAPAQMPEDGQPIVDVEAFVHGELIGGFRKIYRPPVPVHRPGEPVYAEGEITAHPYPPRAREPVELGVELRNLSPQQQTVTVTFGVAPFGIGYPYTPINQPLTDTLPPYSRSILTTFWVPPQGGLWAIQVTVDHPDYPEPLFSQRVLDVDEPLQADEPHQRPIQIHNPQAVPVTYTLGIIPRAAGWEMELSQLGQIALDPNQTITVNLTITAPAELPLDMQPIVDLEAYLGTELVGGLRKVYRPPVPVHQPRDPIYAESEIGVDPYPAIAGQPVALSVELFNPTPHDQVVTATFGTGPFGIGLPFSTAGITPNPIRIFVPAHGAARGHAIWTPPAGWQGLFGVMVTLELPGHQDFYSQRVIDVGEPLEPGVPHQLHFQVGAGTYTQTVEVDLGLIPHKPWPMDLSDWQVTVSPGAPVTVTLIVTPPLGAVLGTGEPIVDVEAFVQGELLGGFRKLNEPPVPLHKPHEKRYAESEITVDPYPPEQGEPTRVGAVIHNAGPVTATVELAFGWAEFGMGIPFTTTGMSPFTRTLQIGPHQADTAEVTWVPELSGHQCLLVRLSDPQGVYEPDWSQRNVDVSEQPPCNTTKVFSFTVYNDSALTVTVDIGLITFNVPPDWTITTIPSDTLTLPPFGSGVVTVMATIPCTNTLAGLMARRSIALLQDASESVPTIDVEGYVLGEPVGGIEIRLPAEIPEAPPMLYLPVVLKD